MKQFYGANIQKNKIRNEIDDQWRHCYCVFLKSNQNTQSQKYKMAETSRGVRLVFSFSDQDDVKSSTKCLMPPAFQALRGSGSDSSSWRHYIVIFVLHTFRSDGESDKNVQTPDQCSCRVFDQVKRSILRSTTQHRRNIQLVRADTPSNVLEKR